MNDWGLGPYFCENPHHALLHHVLHTEVGYYPRSVWDYGAEYGVAMEFGVGDGKSLNCIARYLPVFGFDSFEGLPEDWRAGYKKGTFKADFDQVLANTADNALLVPGLFEDTLPEFCDRESSALVTVRLLHIDCDLYSSTVTVLDNIMPFIYNQVPNRWHGLVIVFDEFHGYPGAELYEQRAWREWSEVHNDVEWDVIGHGHEQWGIRIK